jgi:hypothetical protein
VVISRTVAFVISSTPWRWATGQCVMSTVPFAPSLQAFRQTPRWTHGLSGP